MFTFVGTCAVNALWYGVQKDEMGTRGELPLGSFLVNCNCMSSFHLASIITCCSLDVVVAASAAAAFEN